MSIGPLFDAGVNAATEAWKQERDQLRAAVRDLAAAAQGARITLAWAHGNNYLPMAESPTATSRWDETQLAAALDRHASTIQACRENQ